MVGLFGAWPHPCSFAKKNPSRGQRQERKSGRNFGARGALGCRLLFFFLFSRVACFPLILPGNGLFHAPHMMSEALSLFHI